MTSDVVGAEPTPYIPEFLFGDKVRKIRRDAGESQGTMAQKLQVSSATVAAWETSINMPRNAVSIAQRIELAYGVPAWWLLGLQMPTAPRPGGPEGGATAGLPRLDSNQQPSG